MFDEEFVNRKKNNASGGKEGMGGAALPIFRAVVRKTQRSISVWSIKFQPDKSMNK